MSEKYERNKEKLILEWTAWLEKEIPFDGPDAMYQERLEAILPEIREKASTHLAGHLLFALQTMHAIAYTLGNTRKASRLLEVVDRMQAR